MNEKILVVDDERIVREALVNALANWGYVPVEAADVRTALAAFEAEQPSVAIIDVKLPDGSGLALLRTIKRREPSTLALVITDDVLLENTLGALRAGACDFLRKPVDLAELRVTIRNGLEEHRTRDEAARMRAERSRDFGFENLIGDSPAFRETLAVARKVAASSVGTVLLQGESGTGKDLIARTIHVASDRSDRPYVAITCAAIPANLIESELFGYEKGAFTDAKARKEGLFEQAEGGTLFLDEIGELELALQAKLLRVLDDGTFRRVGGLRSLVLDSRIIAASNRDLRAEAEAGHFRQDLFYRLAVVQIDVPALRERGDDVLLLARQFVRQFPDSTKRAHTLSAEAARALLAYPWPGNVRELRNVVERALILEDGDVITTKYLPTPGPVSPRLAVAAGAGFRVPDTALSLDEVEAALIRRALEQTAGNQTRAAAMLGISRYQLRYRLKKLVEESSRAVV